MLWQTTSQIKTKLKTLKSNGFFNIVISDAMAKMVSLVGGMIIVRLMSKSDYGMYVYVNNAMAMLFLLGDFGGSDGYFLYAQENIRNNDKVKGYCAYGFHMVVIAGAIESILFLVSPLFYPYALNGAGVYVVILFLSPLLENILNFLQVNLRVNLENKKFAIQNFTRTIVSYIVLVSMSIVFGGKGAIISRYVCIVFGLLLLLFFNKGKMYCRMRDRSLLTRQEVNRFNKYSFSIKGSSLVAKLMSLIDIFMIGLIFKKEDSIASYKVASTIPSALMFFSYSVMTFVLPYLVRNNKDFDWIRKKTKYLLVGMFGICGLICTMGIITADYVIPIIFGTQYKDVKLCYVILMINFAVAGGLQIPMAELMATQKFVSFMLGVLLICGILNILLDVVMIDKYGSAGAAMATFVITSIGSVAYLLYFFRNLGKIRIE